MKDPSQLSDDNFDVPAPFEGEQVLNFVDYDIKEKPNGFWLLLDLRSSNGDRASWSGNFFNRAATSTDGLHKDSEAYKNASGRAQAHSISWGGLSKFFKAAGYGDGDLPAPNARAIVTALNKLVSVNGDELKVRATVMPDDKGYMAARSFKTA